MKNEKVQTGSQMTSSDVTSLFTSDNALDNTIEITLHCIYRRNEIVMQITKNVIIDLFLLCTKEYV